MDQLDARQTLAVIHRGLVALRAGDFASAERVFAIALAAARSLPSEDAQRCFPLVTGALSLLRSRQGNTGEAQKLRTVLLTVLDKTVMPTADALFPQLMAEVLNDLQEFQRAIPFYESAAQLLSAQNDPLGVARNLSGAGKCYSRSGLLDHAAIPLRAAVKIYRDHPGDPHLPDTLLSLGTALAKNSPVEAEAAYQEAAAFYEAKMQLAAAVPAWVNLGILCSKQDRHAESLAWYQKALYIREQSPGTPPVRLGLLLNNMANCHRRAGDFTEAHKALDRALTLLKPEDGPYFASAQGTRGLIFSNEGRDHEAVEWLQKGIDEHQKLPSPNLESIATDLEHLIKSLRRLDRPEEAAAAENRLSAIRSTQQNAPRGNVDLTGLDRRADRTAGAVIIELNCGLRPGARYTVDDATRFAERLATAAQEHEAGFYAGRVSIPETTTLMFYGEDGEALYRALKPVLDDYLIAEGAAVSIRQGSQLREIIQPGRVM